MDEVEIRECENCEARGTSWVEFELSGVLHEEHRIVVLCERCGANLVSRIGLSTEEGAVAHFSVDSAGNVSPLDADDVPEDQLN